MIPELFKSVTGSVVRWALQGFFAWLAAKSIITEQQGMELVVALTGAAITLGWSIYQKYKSRIAFLTALNMPAGTPEEMVKSAVSSGSKSSVWSLMLLASLIPFAMAQTACNEDTQMKTEGAIRKIYIGLQGASQGTETVYTAGKIDKDSALGGYKALNQVGLSVKLFKERVRALDTITVENKVQIIPLLDGLISDIDKARQVGLVNIPREQVAQIEIYYEMAKSGAITLKGVIAAIKKPVKVSSVPALSN